MAEGKWDKERLEVAKTSLLQEKAATAYWIEQVNTQRQAAIDNEKSKRNLEDRLDEYVKEHKNAPPYSSLCTVDDSGVRLLERAYNSAVSTARGQSDN